MKPIARRKHFSILLAGNKIQGSLQAFYKIYILKSSRTWYFLGNDNTVDEPHRWSRKKKKGKSNHSECNRAVDYSSSPKHSSCLVEYVGQSIKKLNPGTSGILNCKELLVL